MDLFAMIGKNVEVVLYRKHKFVSYTGRLTDVHCCSICLVVGDRRKWISKPTLFKDSIKCIEKEEKI